MSNQLEEDVHSGEPVRTQQFGLIDLFAIVTVAALLSAMLAPFVRELKSEHRNRMVGLAVFQLAIAAGTIAFSVRNRKRLLEKTGRRITVAYCGEVEWRHWPVFVSLAFMLVLAVSQSFLAFAFATNSQRTFGLLIYQFQLGCFTGWTIARCMWRAYPNSIEFFENGIALGATTFFPWTQIDLRPSQFFADRIVVVYRPAVPAFGGNTEMAQVPKSLHPKLFALAAAVHERE
jgi:hypothetical protein